MPNENSNIPRICFAESIEDCLNAMPEEEVESGLENGLFWAFPFKVSANDPYLRTPEKLNNFVPDAYWTREHWYLQPITLVGRLMQVDDFYGYTFFDADETQRTAICEILKSNGFGPKEFDEFRHFTSAEILANIPIWLSYQIANKLGILEIHTFDYLSYHKVKGTVPKY